MIVCICNRICEDEVRKAARKGAPCVRSAYRSLGCETQCGTCIPYAQEIIDGERAVLLAVDSRAA